MAGELLTRRALARMGLDADQVEEVAVLVRHHLLLVETATRRDLDDPSVVEGVASALGSPRRVRLLHLLTVADGLATGPAAWNDWKGTLVADLAARVLHVLERGAPPSPGDPAALAASIESARPALAGQAARLLATLPDSYLSTLAAVDPAELADELELLADPPGPGVVRYRVDPSGDGHGLVTVCAADRPGTLARTTGVLALHRVSVLRAHVWSTSAGLALQRFAVQAPATLRWQRLGADLDAAWSGRLAVEARLERKARDYRPATPVEPDVRVLPVDRGTAPAARPRRSSSTCGCCPTSRPTRPSSRSGPGTPSDCSTPSPPPSATSTWTSAWPRSTPSATGSSTPSTSAPPGGPSSATSRPTS